MSTWLQWVSIPYLYYYALAVILLFTGVRVGMTLHPAPARRLLPGLLPELGACFVCALIPMELWRRTLWFPPVLLALALLLFALLHLLSGLRGGQILPAAVAYPAAVVVWLWVSEELALPRLLSHLPWQWELALSLLAHLAIAALALLLIRRFRKRIQPWLVLPRAWFWYVSVFLFFAIPWYFYLSWVLDTTGFYVSLGRFTQFISSYAGAHRTLALVGSLALLLLLLLALFAVNRVNRLGKLDAQASMIVARNQALMESYLGVQRYYHDVKHHLEVIGYLAEREDMGGIDRYLRQLEQQRRGIFQSVNSGDIYVDAVLNSKLLEAEHRGIHTEAEVAYPADSRIAPVDICAILANLVDNALEHCGPDAQGGLRLSVGMTFRNRFLILKVCNTVSENPLEGNPALKTSKEKPALHGFGLQSVRAALRAYNGEISFHCDQGLFEVHVTMNC